MKSIRGLETVTTDKDESHGCLVDLHRHATNGLEAFHSSPQSPACNVCLTGSSGTCDGNQLA